MDLYKEMIYQPGFAEGEDLTEVLLDQVAEANAGVNMYTGRDDFCVVEGLAVAYGGLLRTAVDIPNNGRTTIFNPTPNIIVLEAGKIDYDETDMPINSSANIF